MPPSQAKSPVPTRSQAQWYYQHLLELYPDARCALHYRNPYELMVATILSAQCTDARVNLVTPALFQRWPNPQALALATAAEVEAVIRSTGFFRNKAKALLGMSRLLVEAFDGKVPDSMEQLLRLPGVARKTANVVLGNAFGKNLGMVVDTHIGRLARRLGLSAQEDPVKVEQDLMRLFPAETWTILSHLLISHGRQVCAARKPLCAQCTLARKCPRVGVAAL